MYLLLHNLAGFMYHAALYRHGIFTLQFAHQHVNSRCIFLLKHSSTLHITYHIKPTIFKVNNQLKDVKSYTNHQCSCGPTKLPRPPSTFSFLQPNASSLQPTAVQRRSCLSPGMHTPISFRRNVNWASFFYLMGYCDRRSNIPFSYDYLLNKDDVDRFSYRG